MRRKTSLLPFEISSEGSADKLLLLQGHKKSTPIEGALSFN